MPIFLRINLRHLTTSYMREIRLRNVQPATADNQQPDLCRSDAQKPLGHLGPASRSEYARCKIANGSVAP
jgi:hypothetical protein